MRRAVLIALLVAGCAGKPVSPQPAAAGLDGVGFEISSWGRPIDRWQVRADGTASYVAMVSDEGAPFTTYRLEHRAFTLAPGEWARLAALAAQLPQPRPTRDDCKMRATDMPYGTLRLAKGGREEMTAFDVGCRDASYQAFVDQLHAMDALVAEWARAHPVTRVEKVGEP